MRAIQLLLYVISLLAKLLWSVGGAAEKALNHVTRQNPPNKYVLMRVEQLARGNLLPELNLGKNAQVLQMQIVVTIRCKFCQ